MPSEEVEEERISRKKKEQERANLFDELGDFLLESLHHIGQSLDFMSFVEIKDAFGANCLLVCLAIGVDFKVRMLVTTSGPRHGATSSWFHGLVN